jgi:hypothetical protein
MEIIECKGEKFELRNKEDEVTLNELSAIAHILENNERDFTDKWLEVLSILGSKDLVEKINSKKFIEAIQLVQITNVQNKIASEIEINGRTYIIDLDENGEIDLSAKDLVQIEKMVRKGGVWGVKAFALVYKDVDLTSNEHYVEAHLKHKALLFGENVMANIGAPVIFQLSKIILEHIQKLVNANTESVPAT